MDEKVSFEEFLFGDGNDIVIDDMEFCTDRIIMLPKIRPHQLERAVRMSIQYCQNVDFRRRILEKINECPVLIYQLFRRGVFSFEEIKPLLINRNTILLCYYFRNQINDFGSFIHGKSKLNDIYECILNNENNIEQLIEYGFLPSSVEYCLKYDAIDHLVKFDILNKEAKWSPFEWSFKPKSLYLLSFSGFFGSIKCFKYLLMKGFDINIDVISMIICSGCLGLFHLCQSQQFLTNESVCKASEYFHIPLLVFMLENGFEINAKDLLDEFLNLKELLFIMLLLMVILVLLNI